MSSAICFNLDQSKILLSCNGLKNLCEYWYIHHVLAMIKNLIKLQHNELDQIDLVFADNISLKECANDISNIAEMMISVCGRLETL